MFVSYRNEVNMWKNPKEAEKMEPTAVFEPPTR